MAIEIRRLTADEDLQEYARICNNAYPAFPRPVDEAVQRLRDRCPRDHDSELWGAFDGPRMMGGMRLLDYQLNYLGRFIAAGGVGMVAVDLLQKKRGAARELIRFFLDDCERNGQTLAMLYPFRPDFYHDMGFGYGTKMNLYSFRPDSLPLASRDHGAHYLNLEDMPLLEEFSAAEAARRHGYCLMSEPEREGLWKGFGEKRNLVGHTRDGRLGGYLAFSFKRGHENNFVLNDMMVHAWQWDNPQSLAALCSFIHIQADQVNRVVFATQMADFHCILFDVRNGTDNMIPSVYHESNTAGVGLMYRIVSVERFLETIRHRDFGGVTAQINLTLDDSFRPQNSGSYGLSLNQGRLSMEKSRAGGIDLAMGIAEFSAWLMGSADIVTLYRLGLARVNEDALPVLDSAFRVDRKPECISAF